MSVLVPTCCAMFSVKLVLPIEGRAATMTRSDGCSPDVISSSWSKPVGTPVTSPLCSCSFSIVWKPCCTRSLQRHEPAAEAVCRRSRRSPARPRRGASSASSSASYARRQDLVGGEDQAAKRRLLLDDAGVVLDVGRPRHAVDERGDVGGPADLVQLARCAPSSSFSVTRSIGLAALAERHHLVEDDAVRLAEEIVRLDDLHRVVDRSLRSRIAPSTDRSASRLCGSVRSPVSCRPWTGRDGEAS